MLGESLVTVKIENTIKKQTTAVTRDNRMPLLGKDLIAFFCLQPQCKLFSYTISNISTESPKIHNQLNNNENSYPVNAQKNNLNHLAEKTTNDNQIFRVVSKSVGQVTNFSKR